MIGGCGTCACIGCLKYRAGTCPRGGCYDEWRAEHQPWPGPERRQWTNWDAPGEQAHWCRGGRFYPAEACDDFMKYDDREHRVKECFGQVVEVFQDGTVKCGFVNLMGCEECIRRYGKGVLKDNEDSGSV